MGVRPLFSALFLVTVFCGSGLAQAPRKLPKGSIEATDLAWHDVWEPYAFGNFDMRPNVWPDQGVWVNPAAYAKSSPALGDVVVARDPEGALQMRRVVGVGGDSVGFDDGKPTRNGKRLEVASSTLCQTEDGEKLPCALDRVGQERFSVEYSAFHPVREYVPVTVPAGHVFLLADHRDAARDSRDYGTLPVAAVLGRVERVSSCVPAVPDAVRPDHAPRTRLEGSDVWLQRPPELLQKRAADGSVIWTGEGVTLGVRALPIGVRGLAQHFRKLAAEGGGQATRGQERDFAGHCGFLIEGKLELPGGKFSSLWVLVGDAQRSVMLNVTYPASDAGKWNKRMEAMLRGLHWEPAPQP